MSYDWNKKELPKNVFTTFDRMIKDIAIRGSKDLEDLKDMGAIKKGHLAALVLWNDPFKLEPLIAMASGLCCTGSD